MNHTITVRLGKEIAAWLEETAKRTGAPQGQIVRDQLEKAKETSGGHPFMSLAGAGRGPGNLSRREGFSTS